jgi:hypothetical protein
MPNDSTTRSEPVACPFCAQPLKSTGSVGLSALRCDQCGEFSDFGDGSSLETRRAMQTPPKSDPTSD